ncbi:MAG TPA: hypothetical protein VFB38_00875 [Chthonomonadaceae bacterium]|nr:hypothetical protein [Chthonomonadaceae bacterium]
MKTALTAFVRAVHLQALWIRDYIESGRLDQARECALALHLRAAHALPCLRETLLPASRESDTEVPLPLLGSEKSRALAKALRDAAECAQAVDRERHIPYAGSFGEYLESLAVCVEEEVYGPKGLRGLE